MPAGWPRSRQLTSIARRLATATLCLAVAAACTGPDTGDDADPTPTPAATATATATPTEVPSTPTATASPAASPTETPEATPTRAASPTAAASPTPAASPTLASVPLSERLPGLADLPGQGYTIPEEGTRTAEQLAAAYSDVDAHRERLEEWGFKQHLYRAFTRTPSGDNDPLPSLILTTINEYGSDEQADAALQWLRQFGTATGATVVDAPPIGDNAVALTVPTADGVPTASIYVREGSVLFVYFAQGGDPLPAVEEIATNVFDE